MQMTDRPQDQIERVQEYFPQEQICVPSPKTPTVLDVF